MKNIPTFEEFLAEGLIKVPNDLYKSIVNYVLSQYFSYMNTIDKCKDDAKKLANKYKVDIDPKFTPENKTTDLETVLDGLSQKVKDNWKLEFGYIKLIIDWEYKIWGARPKVNASYEESNSNGLPGYFTINPRKLKELIESDNYSMKEVDSLIDTLKATIWHEASHAVQHNALKWLDKNQVWKSRVVRDNPNSSKEDKRAEYLTSIVEFDPTIKSKITQFAKKYDIHDDNTIRKNLAVFVGALNIEGEKPDEFFSVLKQKDFKRWKKAVNKFYMNYDFDVNSLLR